MFGQGGILLDSALETPNCMTGVLLGRLFDFMIQQSICLQRHWFASEHGSHRSMGIGEAKKQQADPDHLWGVSLVRHVLHGHPIPLRLILQRQVTPS